MKISQKNRRHVSFSLFSSLCILFLFHPRIRHRAGKLEIIKRVRVEFRLINVIYNFIIPIKAFFYHLELSPTFVSSLKMFSICLEKDFSCFQVVESNQKSNKFNSASPWSWGEQRSVSYDEYFIWFQLHSDMVFWRAMRDDSCARWDKVCENLKNPCGFWLRFGRDRWKAENLHEKKRWIENIYNKEKYEGKFLAYLTIFRVCILAGANSVRFQGAFYERH